MCICTEIQYLVICCYVKSSRHVVAIQGPVKRCSSNSGKYRKARWRKYKYSIAVIPLIFMSLNLFFFGRAEATHLHRQEKKRGIP